MVFVMRRERRLPGAPLWRHVMAHERAWSGSESTVPSRPNGSGGTTVCCSDQTKSKFSGTDQNNGGNVRCLTDRAAAAGNQRREGKNDPGKGRNDQFNREARLPFPEFANLPLDRSARATKHQKAAPRSCPPQQTFKTALCQIPSWPVGISPRTGLQKSQRRVPSKAPTPLADADRPPPRSDLTQGRKAPIPSSKVLGGPVSHLRLRLPVPLSTTYPDPTPAMFAPTRGPADGCLPIDINTTTPPALQCSPSYADSLPSSANRFALPLHHRCPLLPP
jgi:hypothetical protein